ncbi:MAG: hypothetical protein IMF26_08545 [Candidatus Fermentithermobacillus carboniphilus]|uniref:Uncharacterized protein n=1 Tax=Candidatus Fermentithermobacillus carboniphilus TaxID=3085328 RepID=A0AAT9LBF2_9FIRM|nr:MAG: hypothetical protein IMF26_08545 [Candidatus Fermentithermobacillus carboniphilus]
MKILGHEVNPYQLFLILILLLAAAGHFNREKPDEEKLKGEEATRESPIGLLTLFRGKEPKPATLQGPRLTIFGTFPKRRKSFSLKTKS